MGRPAGTQNQRTTQTVRQFQDYVDQYKLDPMELLFMAMKGKIRGVGGKLLGQTTIQEYVNVRLTAAKELLPYGYSKIATIKGVDPDEGPILLSWEGQQDLFEEPLSLAEKIDSL